MLVDRAAITPKMTLVSERFMALHMSRVRMMPEEPTRAPETISTGLPMTNPVAAAARPEKAFKRAMTTGMSAPPMGRTSRMPRPIARIERTTKASVDVGTDDHPDAGGEGEQGERGVQDVAAGQQDGGAGHQFLELGEGEHAAGEGDGADQAGGGGGDGDGGRGISPRIKSAAPPTSEEARPPKPFMRATIWGMAVIWMR